MVTAAMFKQFEYLIFEPIPNLIDDRFQRSLYRARYETKRRPIFTSPHYRGDNIFLLIELTREANYENAYFAI